MSEALPAPVVESTRDPDPGKQGLLPLAPSPLRHRITHGLAALATISAAAAGGVVLLAVVSPSGALATIGLGIAVGLVLVLSVLMAHAMWQSVTAGGVDVTDEEAIRISHPAFFRSPLEVPVASVRRVAIDDGSVWGESGRNCRFGVHDVMGDGSEAKFPSRTLWGRRPRNRRPGSEMASLDLYPGQAPNVALIFSEPVAVPKLNRVVEHGPLNHEQLAGVLVRLSDPVRLKRHLPEELLGPVTTGDAFHLDRNLGLIEDDGRPAPKYSRLRLLTRRRRRETAIAAAATLYLGVPLIIRIAQLSG